MSTGYLQVIGLIIIGLVFSNASDLIWKLFHPHAGDDEKPSKTYTYVMRGIGLVVLCGAVAWGGWLLLTDW